VERKRQKWWRRCVTMRDKEDVGDEWRRRNIGASIGCLACNTMETVVAIKLKLHRFGS
jgi:hypothetical protein